MKRSMNINGTELTTSPSGRFIVDLVAAGKRRFRSLDDARVYAAWASDFRPGAVRIWEQDKTTKYLAVVDTYRAGQPSTY